MTLIDDIIAKTKERVEKIDLPRDLSERRDPLKSIKDIQKSGKVPVIAEVKPSSPSGLKRSITSAEAAEIAGEMVRGGAAAISVLTEPHFFNGSMENLKKVRDAVKVPVLRKDFIIDKNQIHETDADMILLIARIIREELGEFVDTALSRGLEPLVEVHDKNELMQALKTRTNIIGVNTRNLDTLEIDLGVSEVLIPIIKEKNPKILVISESGINNAGDVRRVLDAGADAVLVGTAIMKGNIFEKTKELVNTNLFPKA
ncbi:MAG: indole-3-glycerol-phosphate synthase [Halobacteriota archaeon]|nr:indole-3-glycerol-phosphate synthase [Halobacteriota archaeon]